MQMNRLFLIALAVVLPAGTAFAQCGGTSARYPKVCDLMGAYDPEKRGKGIYTKPACAAMTSTFEPQIKAAFDCAPQTIKDDLLRLNGIYVLPEGDPRRPFGIRENPGDQHSDGHSYVFLSRADFGKKLSILEAATQNNVLMETVNSLRVTYEVMPPEQDLPERGLLSVIAHEAAHAKWYRDSIAPTECFRTRFQPSWNRVPNRGWVDFADDAGSDHADGSTKHPKGTLTEQQFHTLHRHFASVFGAFSPEEDFGEIYKLIAITGGLISFKVKTTNSESNLIERMTQGVLKNKVECVRTLL
jgi:hypothetical protein